MGPCQGSRDARGFPQGPLRRSGDPLRTFRDYQNPAEGLLESASRTPDDLPKWRTANPETQAVGTLIGSLSFDLCLARHIVRTRPSNFAVISRKVSRHDSRRRFELYEPRHTCHLLTRGNSFFNGFWDAGRRVAGGQAAGGQRPAASLC